MTIMNDREIAEYANKGMIFPFVEEKVSYSPITTRSVLSYGVGHFGYDMRLAGGYMYLFETPTFRGNDESPPINPKQFARMNVKEIHPHKDHQTGEEYYILPPRGYALGCSVERFSLPINVSAIVVGKSTYARCGLMVNCTPMEAGWQGYLTIELANLTDMPIKVFAYEGIAQAQFFRGNPCNLSYEEIKGKYQNQECRPTLPK